MNNSENISPELLERIERFLGREMEPGEEKSFVSEMAADPQLEQQVTELRLLLTGIREAELEEKLPAFHKGLILQDKRTASSGKYIRLLLIAAGITGIVLLTYRWLGPGQAEPEKLYARYYEPDPGLITAMSTSDNYSFYRAMVDYKTGQYKVALTVWEDLLRNAPANDTLNYFAGSASLALEENDRALQYFKKVTAIPGSVFFSDACWYTGLILLKQYQEPEAVKWIERSQHEDKEALLLQLKKHAAP